MIEVMQTRDNAQDVRIARLANTALGSPSGRALVQSKSSADLLAD